jgi:hypothetical protein
VDGLGLDETAFRLFGYLIPLLSQFMAIYDVIYTAFTHSGYVLSTISQHSVRQPFSEWLEQEHGSTLLWSPFLPDLKAHLRFSYRRPELFFLRTGVLPQAQLSLRRSA